MQHNHKEQGAKEVRWMKSIRVAPKPPNFKLLNIAYSQLVNIDEKEAERRGMLARIATLSTLIIFTVLWQIYPMSTLNEALILFPCVFVSAFLHSSSQYRICYIAYR